MGLLVATSGCPRMAVFKPMARFHLPLSSEEETILRAAGYCLLQQFFADGIADPARVFDKLAKIYQQANIVNFNSAKGIKSVSQKDSALNAVIQLDTFTMTLPDVI